MRKLLRACLQSKIKGTATHHPQLTRRGCKEAFVVGPCSMRRARQAFDDLPFRFLSDLGNASYNTAIQDDC